MTNSVSRNINITTAKCLMRLYNATHNFKIVKRMLVILDEGIQKIETMLAESISREMQASVTLWKSGPKSS